LRSWYPSLARNPELDLRSSLFFGIVEVSVSVLQHIAFSSLEAGEGGGGRRLGEQTCMHRCSLQPSIVLARSFGILTGDRHSGRYSNAYSAEIARKPSTCCVARKLAQVSGVWKLAGWLAPRKLRVEICLAQACATAVRSYSTSSLPTA